MGERGATGGAWGARDDASWWSNASGEIQNQQQLNEEIARSTASATHQLYTYKVAGGFSNNSGDTQAQNFDYRLMTSANSRDETPQQPWWFASGSDQQQPSSPTPQNQSSPDSEHSNQQGNGIQNIQEQQQNQIQQHSQLQQQLQQQQTLQQALQQQTQSLQQSIQHQTLQQMLQQQQQQQQQQQSQAQQQQREQSVDQQNTQQSIQIQVSQAQAQALVQAQAVLQQQVAQTLQQQQQTLHEHIQVVQQQQIQAALQRQSANLQELQQQAQQQQSLLNQQTTVTKTRMPRARAYNKPRGRMTAYAYFVQTCREEHKKKHPEENVVFAAFSKKCAERWNTMSEKEKLRFHEMAEQDRKRYDIEMQSYVPPKDIKVRGRKRQQPKDPNAPKRSLSAFFWFCNDERSKVKANNPEYTIGDIAKELGRRWAAVDAATKSKYEQLSEQDKARYDKEMTAYKKGPLALNLVQQQVQQIEEDVGEYEAEDEYK